MSLRGEEIKLFMGIFPAVSFANGSCHMIGSFGNVGVIDTIEGLVIFDIGIKQFGTRIFKEVRKITRKPIKYVIYSHGHFDHCFGFAPFIREIEENHWEMPKVLAHENCVERFKKYKMLDQYHIWLNAQQFASVSEGQTKVVSAHETLEPNIIIHGNEEYKFELGGIQFELFHDKGETDDSIWLWVPDKNLICSGDLMISSFPNVGNPYKVQRYPKDWATAMEKMMEKEAEYLIPGHGKLIEGKEKVKEVLSITAEVMHFVQDEVVKRLNEGKWFEEIYHEMQDIYPERFKNHPYLRPAYGCYQFAIHAVYRLYHGWYNTGNPTDLFPAKKGDIANEFLKINSGEKYLEHAKTLFNENKLQLALHCVDVVIDGYQDNNNILLEAYKLKYKMLKKKIKEETSFIAANILNYGADQIKAKIFELEQNLT